LQLIIFIHFSTGKQVDFRKSGRRAKKIGSDYFEAMLVGRP